MQYGTTRRRRLPVAEFVPIAVGVDGFISYRRCPLSRRRDRSSAFHRPNRTVLRFTLESATRRRTVCFAVHTANQQAASISSIVGQAVGTCDGEPLDVDPAIADYVGSRRLNARSNDGYRNRRTQGDNRRFTATCGSLQTVPRVERVGAMTAPCGLLVEPAIVQTENNYPLLTARMGLHGYPHGYPLESISAGTALESKPWDWSRPTTVISRRGGPIARCSNDDLVQREIVTHRTALVPFNGPFRSPVTDSRWGDVPTDRYARSRLGFGYESRVNRPLRCVSNCVVPILPSTRSRELYILYRYIELPERL